MYQAFRGSVDLRTSEPRATRSEPPSTAEATEPSDQYTAKSYHILVRLARFRRQSHRMKGELQTDGFTDADTYPKLRASTIFSGTLTMDP